MQYFNSLPKIRYVDKNNVTTIYTNLMARASVIPSVLNNALVYYSYDVQDGDTPEIIAYKYYGDVNRFWIVLYCNQLNDPQWDWPLSSNKFQKYILNKYNTGNLNSTHHYERITTKTNINTNTTTVDTETISQEVYNSLQSSTTTTYTLGSETITVNVVKSVVTNYEYENSLNESKRNIKILNKAYADKLESQFLELMK
jgi:hypothetical protein